MLPYVGVLVEIIFRCEPAEGYNQSRCVAGPGLAPVLRNIIIHFQGGDIMFYPGDTVGDQIHIEVIQRPAFGYGH